MSIKKKLKGRVPAAHKAYIRLTTEVQDFFQWQNHRLSCKRLGDENPDKTFFVIRWQGNMPALGGLVVHVALGGVRFAHRHGAIPVVDFGSFSNYYLAQEDVGKKNAWEFYFQQPCGYSMADISHSRHVIFGNSNEIYDRVQTPPFFDGNDIGYRESWKQLYKKYIRCNSKVSDLTTRKRAELGIGSGDRVLGILCRGTDYLSLKPKGHPIQPQPEKVIEKAKEALLQYGCNKVFLATEDSRIAKKFSDAFGDKLLMAFPAYENYSEGTALVREDISRYESGLQYLCILLILSACTCIIGTACGGSMVSALMSDYPEFEYYYWLGLYGIDQDCVQ